MPGGNQYFMLNDMGLDVNYNGLGVRCWLMSNWRVDIERWSVLGSIQGFNSEG